LIKGLTTLAKFVAETVGCFAARKCLPEWHLWHENAHLNGICGIKMLAQMAFAIRITSICVTSPKVERASEACIFVVKKL
jgi:hypothetical protein